MVAWAVYTGTAWYSEMAAMRTTGRKNRMMIQRCFETTIQ
jgi:hypothetical protein